MKLSVFNPVFGNQDLEQTLAYLQANGVQAIEIGVGGYPGKLQLDPLDYLSGDCEVEVLLELFKKYQIQISALSCHGNAVSPDSKLAIDSDYEFDNACRLASLLGVKTVVCFSGCPGGSEVDKIPNWILTPWPTEYAVALDYQWNDVLVPYWKSKIEMLELLDVNVAIEMHPGFCVYNPETMLKLNTLVGSKRIGVNFDPSHLIWQQIDPVSAITELREIIYHFHAKDTYINRDKVKVNGVLDTKSYSKFLDRSWIFRTVGYGTEEHEWKQMIAKLRNVGYDGYISIEHEDESMSIQEGLEKAIEFLNKIIIKESTSEPWWY